jgi:hypothetical protein
MQTSDEGGFCQCSRGICPEAMVGPCRLLMHQAHTGAGAPSLGLDREIRRRYRSMDYYWRTIPGISQAMVHAI